MKRRKPLPPQDILQKNLELLAAADLLAGSFNEAPLLAALAHETVNPNVWIRVGKKNLPGFFIALGFGSTSLIRTFLDHPKLDRSAHGMDLIHDRCISSFAFTAFQALTHEKALAKDAPEQIPLQAIRALSLLGSDARIVPDVMCIGARCDWRETLTDAMRSRAPHSHLPDEIDLFLEKRDLHLAAQRRDVLFSAMHDALCLAHRLDELEGDEKRTFEAENTDVADYIKDLNAESFAMIRTVAEELQAALPATNASANEKEEKLACLSPPRGLIPFDRLRFDATLQEAEKTGICRAGRVEKMDRWYSLHLGPTTRTITRLFHKLTSITAATSSVPEAARQNIMRCAALMARNDVENQAAALTPH